MSCKGIIFTGGEAPPSEITQRLLKTSEVASEIASGIEPLVIAADSGLVAAEEAGFRPDFIIGDMDSLTGRDALRLDGYRSEKIIRHATDKDFTDTELAFSYLLEKECDTIWLVGGGGGRIDHLFGIRSLFERELFPCRWITNAADIWCIDSAAKKNELSIKLKPGSVVSAFPLGTGPWKAKSGGLKWPLDDVIWNRGFISVSNITSDDCFFIRAELGRFMIVLPF